MISVVKQKTELGSGIRETVNALFSKGVPTGSTLILVSQGKGNIDTVLTRARTLGVYTILVVLKECESSPRTAKSAALAGACTHVGECCGCIVHATMTNWDGQCVGR